MEKIDLFQEHKAEYVKPKAPVMVEVGKATYIAIDGKGAPGEPEFQEAVAAMYAMAFTMKFQKKAEGVEYKVHTLEGFYREKCDWTLAIRSPELLKAADLKLAAKACLAKGKGEAVKNVKLLRVKEGRCAQVLQTGPYELAEKTIGGLVEFGKTQAMTCNGPVHEIYLSDPRRVAPEKIKTIVRLPLKTV